MNKPIRNIIGLLFLFAIIYIVGGYAWGILHAQSCSYSKTESYSDCEYIFLQWKDNERTVYEGKTVDVYNLKTGELIKSTPQY